MIPKIDITIKDKHSKDTCNATDKPQFQRGKRLCIAIISFEWAE